MVLVGDAELNVDEMRSLRSLQTRGARVVAWEHSSIVQDRFPSPEVAGTLETAGVDYKRPAELVASGSRPLVR